MPIKKIFFLLSLCHIILYQSSCFIYIVITTVEDLSFCPNPSYFSFYYFNNKNILIIRTPKQRINIYDASHSQAIIQICITDSELSTFNSLKTRFPRFHYIFKQNFTFYHYGKFFGMLEIIQTCAPTTQHTNY
jgi:hypothetical protein